MLTNARTGRLMNNHHIFIWLDYILRYKKKNWGVKVTVLFFIQIWNSHKQIVWETLGKIIEILVYSDSTSLELANRVTYRGVSRVAEPPSSLIFSNKTQPPPPTVKKKYKLFSHRRQRWKKDRKFLAAAGDCLKFFISRRRKTKKIWNFPVTAADEAINVHL